MRPSKLLLSITINGLLYIRYTIKMHANCFKFNTVANSTSLFSSTTTMSLISNMVDSREREKNADLFFRRNATEGYINNPKKTHLISKGVRGKK